MIPPKSGDPRFWRRTFAFHGEVAVRFLLKSAGLEAVVEMSGPVHHDLMDEMARRCVRLFVEANASLPDEVEAEPDDD